MRRIFAAGMLCAAASVAAAQDLPESALSVHLDGKWHQWWRSAAAPTAWSQADPLLTKAVRWRRVRGGLEHAEVRLSGTGEAWRIRLVLVRFDSTAVRAELVRQTRDAGTLGAWTIDSVPSTAIAAVNAGQFSGGKPWGWLVRNGVEEQPPGFGPLSLALVALDDGTLRLIPFGSIASYKGQVALAFQSYPTLLEEGGIVPPALRGPDRGVSVDHRDSRVAVCQQRDGRIIMALTRFEGLRGVLSELPFGPTIPEMSALMGGLGCSSAVALDGGISGQMMVRDGRTRRAWRGMRRVPLGLVLYPK